MSSLISGRLCSLGGAGVAGGAETERLFLQLLLSSFSQTPRRKLLWEGSSKEEWGEERSLENSSQCSGWNMVSFLHPIVGRIQTDKIKCYRLMNTNQALLQLDLSLFCLYRVPRLPVLQRRPRLVLPVHSLVCLAAFGLALPLAISLFPQMSQVCCVTDVTPWSSGWPSAYRK